MSMARCDAYSAAASLHSTQRVVVTPRAKWRGRPISEVAAENAARRQRADRPGEGVEATRPLASICVGWRP